MDKKEVRKIVKEEIDKFRVEIKQNIIDSKEAKEDIYVTTENDMFNAADESHFYLLKDQVKKLPNELTEMITKGLEQGLLKEVSPTELEQAKKEDRYIE